MVELALLILIFFAFTAIEIDNIFYSIIMISAAVFLVSLLMLFLKAPGSAALYLFSYSIIIVILLGQFRNSDIDKGNISSSKRGRIYRFFIMLIPAVLCLPALFSLPGAGSLPVKFIRTPGFRYLTEGYSAAGLTNTVTAILMDYRIIYIIIATGALFAGGIGIALNSGEKRTAVNKSGIEAVESPVAPREEFPVYIKLIIFIVGGYMFLSVRFVPGGGAAGGYLLSYLFLPPFSSIKPRAGGNRRSIELLSLLIAAAVLLLIFFGALLSGFFVDHYPGVPGALGLFAAGRILVLNIITGIIAGSFSLLIISALLAPVERGFSDD